MPKFNVTYERYLPHDDDEDVCDADERGFVVEGVTLRAALQETGGTRAYYETDEWPIRAPRWFTNDRFNECTREEIEQGIRESRSLHLPDSLTEASRRRVARLLGCNVQ